MSSAGVASPGTSILRWSGSALPGSAASWWCLGLAAFSAGSPGGATAASTGAAGTAAAAGGAFVAGAGAAAAGIGAGGGVAATADSAVLCPPRSARTSTTMAKSAPATPRPIFAAAPRPPVRSARCGRSSSNVPVGGDAAIAVFDSRAATSLASVRRGYLSADDADASRGMKTFDGSNGTPPACPSAW